MTTAAEEPMSPEVVLMEENTAKEEPDADDAADQLLLCEDGEMLIEIRPRVLFCWISICDQHGGGRSLVAITPPAKSSCAVGRCDGLAPCPGLQQTLATLSAGRH